MTPGNGFSFRMFDLYRKFIEIIQMNEEFLKAFKTGFPSEEICRAIIAKTFQHRQTDDNISYMVQYLRKNTSIIVSHAENVPEIWSTAVKYTNWCISEIKRYLKNKNISFKSNFESMPGLSKEIGKCLYKSGGNPDQIKIIEEYLREDIRNPKRTIICTQKSKKCKHKEKIFIPIPEKEKQVVRVENEESDSVDVQDESNEEIQIIRPINICQEYSAPQSIFREDLLKTEFTEEIEDLLQPQGYQLSNELLHIVSPTESNEFALQKKDLSQSEQLDETNSCDLEDIKSILENTKCESEDSDFLILEVREETDTSMNKAEYSCNDTSTPSNYYINVNKRKILSSSEPDSCIKKLFISNKMLNSEKNTQYITVNTDDNIKDITCDSVQYVTISIDDKVSGNTCNSMLIPKTTGIETIQIDENHYSISEININNCEINKRQNTNNNQSKVKNKILDASEIKTEPEIKQESGTCNCSTEFRNGKPYITETVKYSDVMNMTYTEVLKIMEKILAFCELKNEISLEEFLVLRRTRDKMEWRSLKEKAPLT